MSSTRKLTTAQQWDLDVAALRNRALAQNARLRDRIRTAYPSLTPASTSANDEAPEAEEKLMIRPENIGVGATWEADENDMVGSDAPGKASTGGIFGGVGELEKLRKTVLGKKRKVNGADMRKNQRGKPGYGTERRDSGSNRNAGDDSEDDEEGRAGAFRSKKANPTSKKVESGENIPNRDEEDIGSKVKTASPPEISNNGAIEDDEWSGFGDTSAESRPRTPNEVDDKPDQALKPGAPARPASYLDEVLAERKKKRKKKKKKNPPEAQNPV